ncbi:MAG: hypothetical protein Q4C95_13085, partial [Planctomycetia bacterium]|nr:hypothetical protein [Planctomycetia bacterium]
EPEPIGFAVSQQDSDDFHAAFAEAEMILQEQNKANLLQAVETNMALVNQSIKKHIKVVIDEARKKVKNDPDGAIQDIKLAISSVRQDPSIDNANKAVLLNDLGATAQILQRQKFEKEQRDHVALLNKAKVDSVQAVLNQRAMNQNKVVEIMKRFDSLVKQEQFILASEVAATAEDLIGDLALPTQAVAVSFIQDAYAENQYLRIYRRKRFLDVLMSVERSHIPTADEPPILYPDPETWINLSKKRKERWSSTSISAQSDAEQKINKMLEKIITVEGKMDGSVKLTEWIDSMSRDMDINIIFDKQKITEQVDNSTSEMLPLEEMTIEMNLNNITLSSALKNILRPYELDYCIQDDALLITTKDEIKNNEEGLGRSIRLYPVADLTLVPTSPQSGGMGGFGGGMGGGMMGGMGGGMFNVPTPRSTSADSREIGESLVKKFMADEGLIAPVRTDGLQQNVSAKKDARVQQGTLTAAPADLNAKWDLYFENSAPQQPVLKTEGNAKEIESQNADIQAQYDKEFRQFQNDLMVKVDEFNKKKQYDEAKALIKSAIRNDLAAPWMYEALVLVLLQGNGSQKEIERAILSAAEFTNDPVSLLGIAAYLETVGLREKALNLYRQISKIMPTRPEPYVRGLALSQDLNDEEAQKWVVLGIASQAWEGKLVDDVWKNGSELAEKLVKKMIDEGRQEEASQFENELAQACVRDIIIEVYWTGDAEIDIAVEEPTKSVCWFAQTRTASGGILRKDPIVLNKSFDELKEGQRMRCYVCPMGFSGEYNVLLTKSWGTLPQNKVGVQIISNAGTELEKASFVNLELKDDSAMFTVELENGRRQEEIKKEILTANALISEMKNQNTRVLDQKVQEYKDAKVANSARYANQNQAQGSNYRPSYSDNIAVDDKQAEYAMPEIRYVTPDDPGQMAIVQSINAGASVSLSAAVSSDRRYVLLNPQPMFTQIVKMFTYNTSTGSMGGGGGYGGGM